METDPLKQAALAAIKDLLDAHWEEAKNAQNEQSGAFGISFSVRVRQGKPVKIKVTSRISKSTSDEIEVAV
ncbi:hypothetical protein EBZ39_02815 [bacterium]|nr:hypothetical protein [bacterium]